MQAFFFLMHCKKNLIGTSLEIGVPKRFDPTHRRRHKFQKCGQNMTNFGANALGAKMNQNHKCHID